MMLPPGSRQGTDGGVPAGASSGGGAAGSSEQQERLVLSEACELLLLQRWCREVLLHEFLTTLHLVSTALSCAHLCGTHLLDICSGVQVQILV
jgi:hypothetical protein